MNAGTSVAAVKTLLVKSSSVAYINRTGTTQLRLRFATDDNNDSAADIIQFQSGDAPIAVNRPELKIDYYIP